MELEGEVIIVTGGARGIGAAICRELAAAGACVIVNYQRSSEAAEALAAQIGGVAVQADVSTTEGCALLMEAAEAAGPVLGLVNNAGITRDGLTMRMKDDAWEDVMRVNAGSAFRMTRAVLPHLAKRRQGSIVNIASVSAVRGNPGQANYAASKAAVVGLTRSLAREMARRNVRVNAVAPGFIATEMTQALTDEQRASASSAIPLGRLGDPEEIAPAVRFLLGPRSSYITGQVLIIDGGLSV